MLIQMIFTSGDTDFPKPLFLTYYSTAFFIFYLIPTLVRYLFRAIWGKQHETLQEQDFDENEHRLNIGTNHGLYNDITDNSCYFSEKESFINNHENSTDNDNHEGPDNANDNGSPRKYSICEMFKTSLAFWMLWSLANYFYNAGLMYTYVSSSTILSNTSILFVFVFTFLFLRTEKFSIWKLMGVLLSFSGATIVTLNEAKDENDPKNSILGDVFTVISALMYGLYATFLKARLPENDEKFSMTVFLGFVGLWNIVLLSPLFLVFHYTGLEPFELPNTKTLMFLSINAIIGTWISDFWWAKSVVLLGPLFTQLGISLTIPLGIVASSFFDKVSVYYNHEFYRLPSTYGIL